MPDLLPRLLTTRYAPDESFAGFAGSETQTAPQATVTVAVLDAAESRRRFGVDLAARGVQPVYLRIENRSAEALRLHIVSLDPNYYTALEAASMCHFSLTGRLLGFGALAFVFLPLLLILAPIKIVTAAMANRRMDECFRRHAFRLRPIPPGSTAEGFVFTSADFGTKELHVRLIGSGTESVAATEIELVFQITVPGFTADHHGIDLERLASQQQAEECDRFELVRRLVAMPPATTNARGTGTGDPVNLVVIGGYDRVLGAFAGRWDETETITAAACWRTLRAFLTGSEYRYSPISPLYLFGRSQDLALQRIRDSIHERLHLRLWMSPLRLRGMPVWVGQISRDIGVRFTTKTWNLTTHKIDADIDESRDYVIEDLLEAARLDVAVYVEGVGACTPAAPRHNLTGDPYHTDGKRAVVMLASKRTAPRFLNWQ